MTKGLFRHPLRAQVAPADAFFAMCGNQPHCLWLDHHGERGSGVTYLAVGSPVELSLEWRAEVRAASRELSLPGGLELGHVPLGIHLVVSYETGAENLGLQAQGGAPLIPRALVVTRVLEISHSSGDMAVLALEDDGTLSSWCEDLDHTLSSLEPSAPPHVDPPHSLTWRDSEERYADMIRSAQDWIGRGDAYQLCVTTTLSLFGQVDPVALHRVMRESNPTHHQALIFLDEGAMVSASPETFLHLTAHGDVITRPIKGTRPRGASPSEDAALRAELVESDKERAENLMIVDLMRNDLSRVCEIGSVSVPELLVVESYATVHQLVSTIRGTVREGCDVIDVLDATFPAGSMTGAPKRRAVEILHQLEGQPRGLYSGTYGVWRADGSAEFAMTIRTAIVGPDSVTIGVGGGITALSDPDEEIREVGIKARAFLRALGVEQVGYS
jgi:anthranilate synthase component 1